MNGSSSQRGRWIAAPSYKQANINSIALCPLGMSSIKLRAVTYSITNSAFRRAVTCSTSPLRSKNWDSSNETRFLTLLVTPRSSATWRPRRLRLKGISSLSTYRLVRSTTAQQIAREMTTQFRKAWEQAGGGNTDVNRLVTLASLVEKETAVPAERADVASVYTNRLKIGMKLDCDPTTIYAAMLEGRYRGTIYRSDLDSPNPYNTYRNAGLPPGPIANPGMASLRAALKPTATSYLYFVARPDGSGRHAFSETLEEHNAAVQAYRSGQ